MEVPRNPQNEKDNPFNRLDLRVALDRFENDLNDLKVRFEQYFTGAMPLPPDKQHADLKRFLRQLRKAPFKNSVLGYRLRTLEQRYSTFNTYWQRVLREREAGTYVRDVFKADMRTRFAEADKHAQTAKGISERGMQNLFQSYKNALEKETGAKHELDFKTFQRSLINRVKDLREQHGGKKITFKVAVENGKVSLRARIKDE